MLLVMMHGSETWALKKAHMGLPVVSCTAHNGARHARHHTRDHKRHMGPAWARIAMQRLASVETVQGGVPLYGMKETLVVNGKKKPDYLK